MNLQREEWMTPREEWRPVLGYEGGYEVSNWGRVRSLPRVVHRGTRGEMFFPGGVLKSWLAHGYPTVNLSLCGRRSNRPVHVLVCEAWHGPRPDGAFARHLDDVRTNLAPENLAWGTPKDNAEDALRNGRNTFKNRTHCRKGHEYSAENTYVNPHGHRSCRTCLRAYYRRVRRERKERGT